MRRFLAGALICLSGVSAAPPALSQEEPATKEELVEVKGALESVSESFTEYRSYIDALRKIKISGYVQAQYRAASTLDQTYRIGQYSGGLFPQYSKNAFQLRRGRFKVTYDNVTTQAVLQVDITERGVGIKDAYLSFTEQWLRSFTATAGIFNRPFGYEVSFSSSSRESPERARVIQTLFPGERDLGLQIAFAPQMGSLSFLRADLALVNGSGPTSVEFDNFKDFLGRVGMQFPFEEIGAALDVGVSGYLGNVRQGTTQLYEWGTTSAGVAGWVRSADSLAVNAGRDRTYFGADAQFYYDLPLIGGLVLRGEYVAGKQPGGSTVSDSYTAAVSGGLYERDFYGWYVYYVQNFGPSIQSVVKYDVYDPNTKATADDFVTGSNLTAADLKYSTLGLGVIYHWDENIKFVLYHELVSNEKVPANAPSSLRVYADNVKDDITTFRIQYRFP